MDRMTNNFCSNTSDRATEWSEEWLDTVGEKGDVFYLTYDDCHSQTSNILPKGRTHEVTITVDPIRSRTRSGDSECEKLFGFIPTKFSKYSSNGVTKNYVMVHALIPGREAVNSHILINEWLMYINDFEVTWENLNSILSAITTPKQIRLTFQQTSLENRRMILARQAADSSSLVKLMKHSTDQARDSTSSAPHCFIVMYMTLDSGKEGSSNDLLYCYTSQKNSTSSKLIALRGMFLTLSNVMLDVSQNSAQISQVVCDGCLVNVAYLQFGKELLTIASSVHDILPQALYELTCNISHVLTYSYGSLHLAMSEKNNHLRLDLYFNLISYNLVSPHTLTITHFSNYYDSYSTPLVLTLPDESKVNVENMLSEFESADFGDMNDDYYDMRRAYSILGTCLYYKGYLVCNHLPVDDLRDTTLFCSHYNLLHTSRNHAISQLVIWQEVFPSRRFRDKQEVDAGYVETFGRYFLMIVAYRHILITTLLEAGGCAAKAMGNPVADSFYINQAHQTLLQLESVDFSVICEAQMQNAKPLLTCIETISQLTKSHTGSKGLLSRATNTAVDLVKKASSAGKSKSKPELSTQSQNTVNMTSMSMDFEVIADALSHGSGQSPPDTPADRRTLNRAPSLASTGSGDSISSNQLYRQPSKGRVIAANIESAKRDIPLPTQPSPVQSSFTLSTGAQNTLFSYMYVDGELGVMLSPTIDELGMQGGSSHKNLLSKYHSTISKIKRVFDERPLNEPGERQASVNEFGVQFQHTADDRKSTTLNYWVIGRKIGKPVNQTIFICYHSSVNENMIELAFKLNSSLFA